MRLKYIKYTAAGLMAAGLLTTTSCKKVLDVEPRLQIDAENALSSPANIEAAITNVYAGLKSTALYGRDMLAVADALSDITLTTGKSGRLVAENRNTRGSHLANWGTSYQLINEANLILDAIPGINTDAASKDRWEGELKFLRALLYLDLVKVYAYNPTAVIASQDKGGVVVKLTGTKDAVDAAAFLPSRATIAETYTQIYADLNVAIAKLTNARGVFYATKAAAYALMSRASLYGGNWNAVVTNATNGLAQPVGRLSTAAQYVAGWRASTNPESIFEIRFATQAENIGVNTSLQTSYTTLVTPGDPNTTGGFGDLVPNAFLLSQLGIASTGFPNITRGPDVRALLYEWGTAGRGARAIETTKFMGKSGFINLDNVPVIRFPELYLNRAEAYFMLNNEAAALADLNTILTNRGLPPAVLAGSALYEEILRQRMLEFAFEGHRFFDLKRLGRDLIKAPANVPFNDIRILAGIPQGEIDGNPNMQQNPGY